MQKNELGSAITVINKEPRSFEVFYVESLGSSIDLTRRVPLVYVFEQTRPTLAEGRLKFVVNVTDEIVGFQAERLNRELHQKVTKFALWSIRQEPTKVEFTLAKQEDESLEAQPKLGHKELKHAILEFIFTVNEEWPSESISIHDLCENLNSTRQEIQEWGNHLVETKLLIIGTSKPSERWGESTRSYRINAANLKEIKEELGILRSGDGKLRIFLSYSHKDKHVAGKVKIELEQCGFDVFLAHDDIEVSEEWEERILEELKSCHVFIPILSGNFEASDWTDQETGHAFANQKVIVPLNLTCNPYGFIRKYQAKSLNEKVVSDSCRAINEALGKRPELASFFNKGSDK